MQYFGQDIDTFSINTTGKTASTTPSVAAGVINITDDLQSVNVSPSDVRQEGTPLTATSVKHRHVRTDDTVRFAMFVTDNGKAEHLIVNRNQEVTFTLLPWSGGTDTAPTFTDTLALLTFTGLDIIDGADVATFELINLELAASS
jgi:hypothetical protein